MDETAFWFPHMCENGDLLRNTPPLTQLQQQLQDKIQHNHDPHQHQPQQQQHQPQQQQQHHQPQQQQQPRQQQRQWQGRGQSARQGPPECCVSFLRPQRLRCALVKVLVEALVLQPQPDLKQWLLVLQLMGVLVAKVGGVLIVGLGWGARGVMTVAHISLQP